MPWMRIVEPVAYLLLRSVRDGAKNQLWASVSPDVRSGELYYPVGVAGKGGDFPRNDELAAELWEWTERELQQHGFS